MNRYRIIFIGMLTAAILVTRASAYAAAIDVKTLPEELIIIDEIYNTGGDQLPYVVFIQDAHCHYDAQKKIVQLVDVLTDTIASDKVLVAIEGGYFGPLDTSSLSWVGSSEKTAQVCDYLMKQGKVNAAEYSHAVMSARYQDGESSKPPFLLYGLEDPQFYEANLNQYIDALSQREDTDALINELSGKIAVLKEKFYTYDLRMLETLRDRAFGKSESVTDETLALHEYLKWLVGHAFQYNVALDEFRPNGIYAVLGSYYELCETLGDMDMRIVSKQAQKLSDMLAKKGVRMHDGTDITALAKAAEDNNIEYSTMRELWKYVRFNALFATFDYKRLLEEKLLLHAQLTDVLLDSDEARQLWTYDRYCSLINKLNVLQLTREESAEVETIAVNPYELYAFINKHLDAEPITDVFNKSMHLMRAFSNSAFYVMAQKRDHVIVEHFVHLMRGEDKRFPLPTPELGVIIAGGYHAEGIKDALRKSGYSFASVMPRITQEDADVEEKYHAALKKEYEPFAQEMIEAFYTAVSTK